MCAEEFCTLEPSLCTKQIITETCSSRSLFMDEWKLLVINLFIFINCTEDVQCDVKAGDTLSSRHVSSCDVNAGDTLSSRHVSSCDIKAGDTILTSRELM